MCNRPNAATLASINTATPTSMPSTNTMPAWQPPTRSPPPMTRPGKFTTTLTLLTIAGLGLTSCASDDEVPAEADQQHEVEALIATEDRKSTRLNSSHVAISYAVFCLKKKKKNTNTVQECD